MTPHAPEPLLSEVRSILAQLIGRPAAEIAPGADLERDLGMDSLRMIEAVVVIEERFQVALPPASSAAELSLRTVAELAELVARLRGAEVRP